MQTTVGFDWVAFAVLFGAAFVAARRLNSRGLWVALAVSFALLWLPHLVIAVGFLVNGA